MSNSDSTARFCKKCNSETERHTSGRCKPCLRLLNANWRSKNPGKVKAQSAAQYASNPEKARARNAAWVAENPGKVKENNSAHYSKNKAKVMVQQAAWRAVNPEKGRASRTTRRRLALKFLGTC